MHIIMQIVVTMRIDWIWNVIYTLIKNVLFFCASSQEKTSGGVGGGAGDGGRQKIVVEDVK